MDRKEKSIATRNERKRDKKRDAASVRTILLVRNFRRLPPLVRFSATTMLLRVCFCLEANNGRRGGGGA
ncbi:hypothetical protein B296_00021888 [Ensete ventricosum]|uniref:Uncharacterized protein n=1 Tax=Ensete ventricosum TaxID=4639 RepID=A0A427AMH3_ENSVE|nr:hypothetical protein B296_00021888 [Ensete ventricosum]